MGGGKDVVEKSNQSKSVASESNGSESASSSLSAPNYSITADDAPSDAGPSDPGEKYKIDKMQFLSKLRQLCIEYIKDPLATSDEKDALEALEMKAGTYRYLISEAPAEKPKVKEIFTRFTDWKDYLGYESFEAFKSVKAKINKRKSQQEAQEAEDELALEEANRFSQLCEDVYADMNKQFGQWNGLGGKHRGAWWGTTGPGRKRGAKSVGCVEELKRKVKLSKNGWVFKNSFSGGVSFHRTGGSIDFIYHMLPPED